MRWLLLLLPLSADLASADLDTLTRRSAAPPAALPACVRVATESRYVPYGYNHVVLLENGCSKAASCTVSTDVSPDKRQLELAPSAKVEVTTFMGSPSQTFVASVACTLR